MTSCVSFASHRTYQRMSNWMNRSIKLKVPSFLIEFNGDGGHDQLLTIAAGVGTHQRETHITILAIRQMPSRQSVKKISDYYKRALVAIFIFRHHPELALKPPISEKVHEFLTSCSCKSGFTDCPPEGSRTAGALMVDDSPVILGFCGGYSVLGGKQFDS